MLIFKVESVLIIIIWVPDLMLNESRVLINLKSRRLVSWCRLLSLISVLKGQRSWGMFNQKILKLKRSEIPFYAFSQFG